MSCPYTFPQNGKAERIIRSTNNIILSPFLGFPSCSILGGGSSYLNRILTKTICAPSPYVALLGTEPSCEHLRVFGCACYPNMSATAPHKLAPRSIRCTFLGYSSDHEAYHCLDPSINRIIISRHVIFDETYFSFSASSHAINGLDFLSSDDDVVVLLIGTPLPAVGTSSFSASHQAPVAALVPASSAAPLSLPGALSSTAPTSSTTSLP
jgi:hypothetical protein